MPFETSLNGGGTKRDDDFGLRSIYRNPAAPSIPSDGRYNGTGRVFVRVNLTNLISPPSGARLEPFPRAPKHCPGTTNDYGTRLRRDFRATRTERKEKNRTRSQWRIYGWGGPGVLDTPPPQKAEKN